MKMTRVPWPAESIPLEIEPLMTVPGSVAGPWRGMYMISTPNGIVGAINTRIWTISEHDDGTITVHPSIAVDHPHHGAWHGYLERGVWRSV